MKPQPINRHWSLETLMASLRQQYPTACLQLLEDQPDQVVLQLNHFTITLTNQGMVEVSAPLNVHARAEHLANMIEHILSVAPGACAPSTEIQWTGEEEGGQP